MLRPLKNKKIPSYRLIACDIETEGDAEAHAILYGAQTQEGEYYSTESSEEYAEWLVSQAENHSRTYAYFHNLSFDIQYLHQALSQHPRVYDCKAIVKGGQIVAVHAHLSSRGGERSREYGKGGRQGWRRKLEIRDSMALMPRSLDALAQDFGVVGKLQGVDRASMHALWRANPDLVRRYLQRDCEALMGVLEGWWSAYWQVLETWGRYPRSLPATGAKAAMVAFQSSLAEPLVVPWNRRVRELLEAAYRGGRVDVLGERGQYDDVSAYDVNSMYPAVMVEAVYPWGWRVAWQSRLDLEGLGVHRVEWEQPRGTVPVLEDRETGVYGYSGSGVYTTPELQRLVDMGGRVTAYHEGLRFIETARPFETIIGHLYEQRLHHKRQNHAALSYCLKILMNSLYGKFGEREQGESFQDTEAFTKDEYMELVRQGRVGMTMGSMVSISEERAVEHKHDGLAAYVTAYARLKLHEAAQRAYDAGAYLIYCDTDSLHMRGELPGDLVDPDRLGAWSLEARGPGSYWGKKLYEHDEKIKAKGAPKINNLYSFEDFRSKMEQGGVDVDYRTHTTPREHLLDGKPPGWHELRRRLTPQTVVAIEER